MINDKSKLAPSLSEALYDAANLSHLHHNAESPYHRHTDELMATPSEKHRLAKDAFKIAAMDYLLDNPHRNKAGLNFHVSELTGTPKHLVAIHNDIGYDRNPDKTPCIPSFKDALMNMPRQLDLTGQNRPHEINAIDHTMKWWHEHAPFVRMAFDAAIDSIPIHKRNLVQDGFERRADVLDSMADRWHQSKDLSGVYEG